MSPQKQTKNRKHRWINWIEITKKSTNKIWISVKKYWVTLGIWTIFVIWFWLIWPWNDISLASEEKTPRWHIKNATYNKENKNITVSFCHEGWPEIQFGDKYPGFNLSLEILQRDTVIKNIKFNYPIESIDEKKCVNLSAEMPHSIEGKLTVRINCTYTGDAWFAKCSLNPLDIKEVSLKWSNIVLIDATWKNDSINLSNLKAILERYGAQVIITQAPGKWRERDWKYRNPQERAVIFSDESSEDINIASSIIRDVIPQLKNNAISFNLSNILQPEWWTDYALMLDLIWDCSISTNERENICDYAEANFDTLLASNQIHLFGRNLLHTMNNSILIVIPTTQKALEK